MQSLYEILKTSKLGAGSAPDMYTALMSQKMGGGGGSVIEYTGAVPVTIRANGEPLLACTISGNMQQSSVPTPENPIQPEECGERTGNLFDKNTDVVSWYIDTSGRVVRSSSGSYSIIIPCKANQNLICTFPELPSAHLLRAINFDHYPAVNELGTDYKSGGYGGSSMTFTTSATAKYVMFFLYNSASGAHPDMSATEFFNQTMLNTGSTALPYEPCGFKIPISSGNTTTPIYLGEVETTRKIKKLVLTGEENFVEAGSGGIFRLTLDGYLRETVNVPYCTHYEGEAPVEGVSQVHDLHIAFLVSGSGNNYMYIRDDNYTGSASNFKAYLTAQYAAGTPVTVWYVLAEPTTGIVNEPLRKIGDYADTISNVAEIPTTAGEQTFDVDTTLKPSEVYIKYRGG